MVFLTTRLTSGEQDLVDQLESLGFELYKVAERRYNDFLYFKNEKGSIAQISRNDLDQEFVDMIKDKFGPKPKSKKKRSKRKTKKDLTGEKKSSTMDSNTEDFSEGVTLTPEESKAIDEQYIETHWSKPQE